jgi:predicted Zn finger-like uncharacterized protein
MLGKAYCPHCQASFNISAEHLSDEYTLVRCGRCLETFDLRSHFIPSESEAQLELPIAEDLDFTLVQAEPEATTPVDFDVGQSGDTPVETWPEHDVSNLPEVEVEELVEAIEFAQATVPVEPQSPLPNVSNQTLLVESEPTASTATDLALEPEQPVEYEFDEKPRRLWLWIDATVGLLLLLLLQVGYMFRADLAARFPLTKPALVGMCEVLQCSVPLPQHASLMSIESSDLADLSHGRVVLNALLRNHAGYVQAFPNLELTFNDMQDNPLARRIFKPADYLPASESASMGFPPNHEVSIKLLLDTMDIKPAGYRLVLFYPGGQQ